MLKGHWCCTRCFSHETGSKLLWEAPSRLCSGGEAQRSSTQIPGSILWKERFSYTYVNFLLLVCIFDLGYILIEYFGQRLFMLLRDLLSWDMHNITTSICVRLIAINAYKGSLTSWRSSQEQCSLDWKGWALIAEYRNGWCRYCRVIEIHR
jgi:hypothetical protein